MPDFRIPPVEHVSCLHKFHIMCHVLRLDLVHPVISGNKWFKLNEYLEDALSQNKKALLTFGGAYSNHIIATAAAAKESGLKSIGVIRGEEPKHLSYTLTDALEYGMQLFFVSREAYKSKEIPVQVFKNFARDDIYVVNEGGYGEKGVIGAKEILQNRDYSDYHYIITAVGTGTTLAGLVLVANKDQKIIGINVLKNPAITEDIKRLLPGERHHQFTIINDYHFGGYAKYNQELFDFMNNWYQATGIPTDFVYTGKLFYGISNVAEKSYFTPESKLLVIHSGGLQGNKSLGNGKLIF